jgi:hypothetical protein
MVSSLFSAAVYPLEGQSNVGREESQLREENKGRHQTKIVIAREGGRSSTPGPLNLIAASGILDPRFRGDDVGRGLNNDVRIHAGA